MLRDPRNRRPLLARFLVPTLVAALAPVGCGNDSQSGGTTPPAEATHTRQKEMFEFMKERGKAGKQAPKAATKGQP